MVRSASDLPAFRVKDLSQTEIHSLISDLQMYIKKMTHIRITLKFINAKSSTMRGL